MNVKKWLRLLNVELWCIEHTAGDELVLPRRLAFFESLLNEPLEFEASEELP